jgi:hypothetical protein
MCSINNQCLKVMHTSGQLDCGSYEVRQQHGVPSVTQQATTQCFARDPVRDLVADETLML